LTFGSGNLLDGTPLQGTVTNEIHERLEDREREDADRDQAERAQVFENHGPRVQKDDFDIEHDEDHGDEEELDREPHRVAGVGATHPTFVRAALGWRGPVGRQQAGRNQAKQCKDHAQHEQCHDG